MNKQHIIMASMLGSHSICLPHNALHFSSMASPPPPPLQLGILFMWSSHLVGEGGRGELKGTG